MPIFIIEQDESKFLNFFIIFLDIINYIHLKLCLFIIILLKVLY